MPLEDLICISAASLLAGKVRGVSRDGWPEVEPTDREIEMAVETAKRIWQATIKSGRTR